MVRSFLMIGRRSSSSARSDGQSCVSEKAKAVLQLVRSKGQPLTPKQLDYCSEACIGRFLKAKGNHVKKAAKQLRATLAWRASLDIDYFTADEFSAELARGNAYVAGEDKEGRPVLVVRLKPDDVAGHGQKQFIRYFIFTMEVAIASMPPSVEQCVLILDAAGCHKRGALGFSTIVQLLKVLGEHYPERLARSFIVDAPAMFFYLWKGMSKVLDLKVREKPWFVLSKKCHGTGGAKWPSSSASGAASHLMRAAKSYSNRNLWPGDEPLTDEEEDNLCEDKFELRTPTTLFRPTFAVSDTTASVCNSVSSLSSSLSTSLTPTSSSSSSSTSSSSLPPHHPCRGPALVSDRTHARSLSFASVATCKKEAAMEFRSFRGDTQPCRRLNEDGSSRRWSDLAFGTMNDDFLSNQYHHQNHADFGHKHNSAAVFRPYYSFFTPPYDEAAYRARMKPPLAGLISIISPDLKFRQPSFSLHSSAMEAMLHHLHFD